MQCDIQKGSFVAAFRAKDGEPVWRTERDEIPSWPTPTVAEIDGKAELVTHATKFIRGYDPPTGQELWRLGPNSEVTAPTPIVAHGLVYVTNGYRGIQPIYAIRLGGTGDLTLPEGKDASDVHRLEQEEGRALHADADRLRRPALRRLQQRRPHELGREDGRAGLPAADRRAGRRVQRLARRRGRQDLPLDGGRRGERREGRAGSSSSSSTNPIGEVLMATPALSEGVLYVRGMQSVFAIGKAKAVAAGQAAGKP